MSAPQRIQRRRTAGWRMPPGAKYVGRPSRWGNPFTALPCYVVACRGALLCVGHPLCVDCGAGVRDGSLVWDEEGADGADVELQVITTGGLR